VLARPHEYIEVVAADPVPLLRCVSCGHVFCEVTRNYKSFALRRNREFEELAGRRLPSGAEYLGRYQEYFCPGCGTQLEVDVHCPALDSDEPLWDIALDAEGLRRALT